jgi:undecaprenyl-diphosphatase
MTLLQALLLAVLQGASELFPVSSLGHAVVLPALLHWHIDENGPLFLPFLVMLHVGTATALLAYFWKDWLALGLGVVGLADPQRVRESRRVAVLIVVATLPAVVIGFAAEKLLRHLFGAPSVVALFLAANGVLLAVCEHLRAKAAARELSQLRLLDALVIGCWQCLALIPGLSRSGATIAGGLLRGIDHEAAAHFSFLIATPIIIAATVLEVPKLRHADVAPQMWQISIAAAVVAGVVAWLSTAFLMRWFRNDSRASLDPFATYCVAAGLVAFGVLRLGG